MQYVVLGSEQVPQCQFTVGPHRLFVEVSKSKCNISKSFIGNSMWDILTLRPILPPVVPMSWSAPNVVCSCETKRDASLSGDWQVSTAKPRVYSVLGKGELKPHLRLVAVTEGGEVEVAPGSALPSGTERFVLEAGVSNELAITFGSCIASPGQENHPHAVTLVSDFCLGSGWDQRYLPTTLSNVTKLSSYAFVFSGFDTFSISCTILACDTPPCGTCGQRLRRLRPQGEIDVSVTVKMPPLATRKEGWPLRVALGGQPEPFQSRDTVWQSLASPSVPGWQGSVTMMTSTPLLAISPSARHMLSRALSDVVHSITNRSAEMRVVQVRILHQRRLQRTFLQRQLQDPSPEVGPALRIQVNFVADWANVSTKEHWVSICNAFSKASHETVTDALVVASEKQSAVTSTSHSMFAFEEVKLLVGNEPLERAHDPQVTYQESEQAPDSWDHPHNFLETSLESEQMVSSQKMAQVQRWEYVVFDGLGVLIILIILSCLCVMAWRRQRSVRFAPVKRVNVSPAKVAPDNA